MAKKYYWIEKLTTSFTNRSRKTEWEFWDSFTNKKTALKEFKRAYFVNGKPDKYFRLSEVTVTPIDVEATPANAKKEK